jgi:hypothetical protein
MDGVIIVLEMKRYSVLYLLIIMTISAAYVGMFMPVTSTPQIFLPTLNSPLQLLQPTPTSDPSIYGGIKIKGNSEFVAQTRAALTLLEQKAPDAFRKIQTYVGIIGQGQHSGMWAWEQPPRYEVNDVTAFYSVSWYASTIAHDATHSELYAQYQATHPGKPVPEDAYGGVPIERFCIGYQLNVARRIGAPQSEIDYLSTLDGTHCDVDHDGDCDWQDYQNRNW